MLGAHVTMSWSSIEWAKKKVTVPCSFSAKALWAFAKNAYFKSIYPTWAPVCECVHLRLVHTIYIGIKGEAPSGPLYIDQVMSTRWQLLHPPMWWCRWDSAMHPKSVHFTWFYITKHMEEHHHWEYQGIEADSRLGLTIRSILVALTRPLQFVWRNSVKNWWSNAHYKFFVLPAMSLIYLSLSILHQIGCGNLRWSCTN